MWLVAACGHQTGVMAEERWNSGGTDGENPSLCTWLALLLAELAFNQGFTKGYALCGDLHNPLPLHNTHWLPLHAYMPENAPMETNTSCIVGLLESAL